MTKPNETEGLEPCPFCGPESELRVANWACWYVRCEDCRAEQIGQTQVEAIAAWNRRAPAEPVADAGGVIEVNRIATLLMETWKRVDPNSGVAKNMCSYVATFADMARAIVADRLQSVAAATAAKDAEIARLREALEKIERKGVDMRSDFSRSAEQSRIARAALSEAREAGE